MGVVAYIVALVVLALAYIPTANASTFNLPLNGEIEITGNIPSAISVSVTMRASLDGVLGIAYTALVGQSGQSNGPFARIQGCVHANCGTFEGFVGCGGNIGCGFDPIPSNEILAIGDPSPASDSTATLTFNVSDSSRYLATNTILALEFTLFNLIQVPPDVDHLQLTIDLPDGFHIAVLQGATFNLLTPLPTALSLFVTGLGTLSLFGWQVKNRPR